MQSGAVSHPENAAAPNAAPGAPVRVVGVIGLGIMGGLYARHLLAAGFAVAGYDVAAERQRAFVDAGGQPCTSAAEVIEHAGVVVVALSAIAAFQTVMLGADSVARLARAGQVVVETGTLPIALKQQALDLLQQRGAQMIDAPVTGTRMHAERKELVVYASGDEAVVARVRPVIEAFARDVRYVGSFGAGMKLKLVTNHLVAVHNVATAEALALAASAGLDLRLVHGLIAGGPASSAVFGFRGPLMIDQRYEPATMRMDVFEKDLQLIEEFARTVHAATPLFAASHAVYRQALAQGMKSQDAAAVFEILRAADADADADAASSSTAGHGARTPDASA